MTLSAMSVVGLRVGSTPSVGNGGKGFGARGTVGQLLDENVNDNL